MSWKSVGDWIKQNAGTGAALVGSLITGNVPGAVAAGVSLVSGATGTDDPEKALETLQKDPQAAIRLKELYYQNEDSIRRHVEAMELAKLRDRQEEHRETQETIRGGDIATDEYVRRTRPGMARESWFGTITYCLGCFGVQAITGDELFDPIIASIISAPAWAYLGLRTGDKFADAWKRK